MKLAMLGRLRQARVFSTVNPFLTTASRAVRSPVAPRAAALYMSTAAEVQEFEHNVHGDETKVEEMSVSELRQVRLDKVQAMKEAGVEPFEYAYKPTTTAAALQADYEGQLADGAQDEDADVAVAGRIMTRQVFANLALFTLQDETGTIQLQLDKNRLGPSFKVRVFGHRAELQEGVVCVLKTQSLVLFDRM